MNDAAPGGGASGAAPGGASSRDLDRDLLAAEYAVGALSPAEARAVEAAARHDPAFAAAVAEWLRRLAPLGALIPPTPPPPEVWTRLALATGIWRPAPAVERAWRGLRAWRAAALGVLVLAGALALMLALPDPAPPPLSRVAALLPVGAPDPAFLVRTDSAGGAQVTALSPPEVPPGHGLELWALPPGATRPVSLGAIPAGGGPAAGRVPAQSGTRLLVSLEPAGRAPAEQPTEPVLYSGVLAPAR